MTGEHEPRFSAGEKVIAGGVTAAAGALAIILARRYAEAKSKDRADPSVLNSPKLKPDFKLHLNKMAAIILTEPLPDRSIIKSALDVSGQSFNTLIGQLKDRGLIEFHTGRKLPEEIPRHFMPTTHLIDAARDPDQYPLLAECLQGRVSELAAANGNS